MPMDLQFNPALTVQTRIPVASDGTVHLYFTAVFGSRDAYEHARDTGAHVEMWTNLPAGDCADEWHALRFKYATSLVEDKVGRVISLAPSADALGTPDAGRAVSFDLALKNVHVGSSFSFTYRIVHSSGHIEWLGAYGRNGTLVFESGDDRLEWADGWTLTGDEATKESTGNAKEDLVAVLNEKLEWTCWAFGEHGWPTLSAAKDVPSSKTMILIPQRLVSSVVEPQAILLSVLSPGSIRIDKNGCIYSEQAQTIQIVANALNAQSVLPILQKALPGTSQILELTSRIKCIVVATPSSHDITFPIAFSFIPLMLQEEGLLDVLLRNADLRAVEAIDESSDLVLTTLSKTTFCFMGSEESENVTVRVGKCGGQLLLSEVHTLNSPHPSPWKFAMLSPTTCAQVEPAETASALPTPPPSPPPMSVSFTSRRSLPRDTAESVETVVPISIPSYQSFQSLAESYDSESETVVPLSPTSIISDDKAQDPEDIPTTDAQEETEGETTTSNQLTGTPRPHVTLNDGFLRFLFTWFVRAFLARVWGFVDTGFRWIGFPPFVLGQGMGGQVTSGAPTVSIGTVIAQQIHGPSSATIQEIESIEVAPTESPDEEEESGVDETSEQQEVDIPLHQPIPVSAPAPVTAPKLASPIVRRHKARFLADVRSNIVSFLVHAPHVHAKLSELSISINEKRVESGPGYSCSQLSDDVYLLGLQGPETGSKVEVALD